MKKKGNTQDIFIILWIAFGIIVIIGYFLFSVIIGGSAGNGYQQGEHYFVCSHEEIFEVSKVVWMVSRVWEILFWVFIPLTPIGAFLIANIQEKIEQRKNILE